MGEDQALARLQDILARPEYQVDVTRAWYEQLLQPVWDLLLYLFALLVQTVADSSSGREGWFGLAVIVLCACVIVAALVYLVRAVRLSVTRESRASAASLAERREQSERLWQTAQQLAAAGQLTEAVRILYLSALYALDERALLHVESGLTNREHARALARAHPEVARKFSDVVDTYDRLRYGGDPVSRTTFADLAGRVDRSRRASLHGAQL